MKKQFESGAGVGVLIPDPDSEQTPVDPEAAAKDAVRDYDPEQDPRLWRALSQMWRSVATEFCEVASGYQSDGRSHETAGRLSRELADRIAQEQHSFAEFKDQFRRTAGEWLARQKSNLLTDDMHRQMTELHREREAASARAAEQDRQNRERQALELEARAAALRSGPQSRTTSYLAR